MGRSTSTGPFASWRSAVSIPVAAALLVLVGCGAEPRDAPLSLCLAVSDCATSEYRCINGFCVPPGEDPTQLGVFSSDSGMLARDDAGMLIQLEDAGTPAPRLANGVVCGADAECESAQCECTDFACTVRVCAAADCLCGYGTSGSCTDPMTGREDPEDCAHMDICLDAVGACAAR